MEMTAEKFCENGEFYYNLAKEYQPEHNYSLAITCFESALSLDANCARAYTGLSFCYGNLGNTRMSMEFAVKANEVDKKK